MEGLQTCLFCQGTGYVHPSCDWCGGMGSEEAYRDELYREALEEVAAQYGGSICSGEGDPTDVFFCMSIEEETR
jgi:DnaJ-class molecular chaperone